MSTELNETPETVEPTKSLFAGNPSAADDAAVAAIEALTEVPSELVPTEALASIEASPDEISEVADEAPAEVEAESTDVLGVEPVEETPVEPQEPVEAEPAPVETVETPIDPLEQMKQERAAIDKKIKAEQKAKRKAVIDQIVVVARNYEIPTKDIVDALGGLPSPSKGTKAPVTHKDDKGNTWTGRGKTPKWLAGKNPDDYLVKS